MYLYKFLAQKKKNTIYNNYKDTVCLNLLAFSTFINDSDDPSVLPYFGILSESWWYCGIVVLRPR